tara:strand:- start:36 stop:326 length:291 start_codon:yes stop_codon:yes gene_type:complete
METLIKNITAEFDYVNDSEYYFSSTIEGKEYEIFGHIYNGYIMSLIMTSNNEDFESVEVSKALNKLANDNYTEETTAEDLKEADNFDNSQYVKDKL